jgi:D-glycero-D-manno-heptose 1,7-bisphosphate phosphatase
MNNLADRKKTMQAAFLDRDGVINVDKKYVYKISDFEFIPNSLEAMRSLQNLGYIIVIVTNQSGIARGLFRSSDFDLLMTEVRNSFDLAGITISGVYYCPHLPDAPVKVWAVECDCRKPMPGMLLTAARDLSIDLAASIMVGDKHSDVIAGRHAGVGRCYRIAAQNDGDADGTFRDLASCVDALVHREDV